MKTDLVLKLIEYGHIAPGVEINASVTTRDGHPKTEDIILTSVRENRCIGKTVSKDNVTYQFEAENIHKISGLYIDNFLKRHQIDEYGNRIAAGRKPIYK
jgi:hypothetical protein|tara:strand:+ start:1896 stop:2195 length:300 start_codon:yes stop_codon:yes gene_type:complete